MTSLASADSAFSSAAGGRYFPIAPLTTCELRGIVPDALIQCGNGFIVAEVKAGQTITSDMTGPALRVADLLTSGGIASESVLIHGGSARQLCNSVTYLPWSQIQEFAWSPCFAKHRMF